MRKRGALSIELIVVMVILLIVAALVIFVFQKQFGKQSGVVEGEISSLGDCDGDGVKDFLDKCQNSPGLSEFDGCGSKSELNEISGEARQSKCSR